MSVWEMPDSISPSRMSTFLKCPLQFRFESIQKHRGPSGPAATAGTTVHAALEVFMARDQWDRTPENLEVDTEAALAEMKETDEYRALSEEQLKQVGFDAKVRRCSRRVLDLLDVQMTDVVGLELHLEVDLDGWILRGIIDLAERRDERLFIEDYKSGRVPSERFQASAMLGLKFYSVMAEIEFGEIPAEVALLYLDSRKVISATPTQRSNDAMRGKILAVRDAIGRACDRDDFRPSPSKLCDWCVSKPWCPAHGGNPDDLPVPVEVQSPDLLGS